MPVACVPLITLVSAGMLRVVGSGNSVCTQISVKVGGEYPHYQLNYCTCHMTVTLPELGEVVVKVWTLE